MPKRSSTNRDSSVTAFRVVERAIGEHINGAPLEDPDEGKNKAADLAARRASKRERQSYLPNVAKLLLKGPPLLAGSNERLFDSR
jgi:hypothetical protein